MKLLLAEDEKSLSRALVAILQHSDYEVDAVYDGLSALEYLRRCDYDAVILDIMMPGADGIEVLKRTRAADNHVPIIMLTAKSEVADKVEGLDAGANDYLTKPFAAKELLARIRAITRAATAIDSSTLSTGNMKLNCDSCVLFGPNGEEHLANREFQLMQLFMSNPGTRVPTERLLMDVWGDDAPEGSNVVWVYISYLRKKLTKIGSNMAIKASRNQGYSLEQIADESAGEQAADAADGSAGDPAGTATAQGSEQ